MGSKGQVCGPATKLQPRLPSHGLHRRLSSIRVRRAMEGPIGPLCCSLTSVARAIDVGFLGDGGLGGWHKALVVGSVSLWRRLLASRP